MKLKYIIIIMVLELLFIFIIGNSYALDEENINNVNVDIGNLDIILEYDNNVINFSNNVYNFIDLIDDSLIPTASFNISSILNENYDFLTIFAINFILENEEYYKDKIILGEDYTYSDGYNTFTTNKYVDKSVIYDITNNVFGKSNYYIVNDYLNIKDNLIPLLLIRDYDFYMELDEIVDINSDYSVLVKYKNMDLIYKYVFELNDNNLILKNLEVY